MRFGPFKKQTKTLLSVVVLHKNPTLVLALKRLLVAVIRRRVFPQCNKHVVLNITFHLQKQESMVCSSKIGYHTYDLGLTEQLVWLAELMGFPRGWKKSKPVFHLNNNCVLDFTVEEELQMSTVVWNTFLCPSDISEPFYRFSMAWQFWSPISTSLLAISQVGLTVLSPVVLLLGMCKVLEQEFSYTVVIILVLYHSPNSLPEVLSASRKWGQSGPFEWNFGI